MDSASQFEGFEHSGKTAATQAGTGKSSSAETECRQGSHPRSKLAIEIVANGLNAPKHDSSRSSDHTKCAALDKQAAAAIDAALHGSVRGSRASSFGQKRGRSSSNP